MAAAPERHERLRSGLRLVLAMTGLLIYVGDTSEHAARRPFAQAVLLLFLLYSAVTYVLAIRRQRYIPSSVAPWIDLGWVTLLVAVSQATSSIFYPLYLFVILYASFGQGFRSGITVAIASAASFAVVGVLTAPESPRLDVNAFVTRPLYLLVLGYLIAVWGGYEVRSRSRLALLRDVTALSNPRFGVERTVGRFLEAVRAFCAADSCWLVVSDERTQERWMRTVSASAGEATRAMEVPAEMLTTLLPSIGAFVAHADRGWIGRTTLRIETADHSPLPGPEDVGAVTALAVALDAGALLSVPFRYHASALGRLHVVRHGARSFDRGELDFMRDVLDQVVPVLENLRLVDRLASDAAKEERRRIARDLHDSVIQPYLGLRIGLSAAHHAIATGRPEDGTAQLQRLVELADGEVETLRRYVRDLRAGEVGGPGGLLDAGVRRFCSRFSEATGIHVEVVAEGPPVRNDRLAAEVLQLVAEALSNVRRHTGAKRSEVRIRATDDRLLLTVTNDAAAPAVAFFPRSLGERAAALGGGVRVEAPEPGLTAVQVEIPL